MRRAYNRNASGDTCCEFLERYPDLPTRTIARLIVQEKPGVFRDAEAARSLLRTYRGAHGDRHRRFTQEGNKFRRSLGQPGDDNHIPLPPPLTEADPWRVVEIDFKRALLLYDIHIPYHDTVAVKAAMKYGRKLGVDCVILPGDLMDFHSISHWDRDPTQRDLARELRLGERFLEVLVDTFPKARIIYLEGNHEARLWRFVWRNVPEFAGLPELSLKEILHCGDYGIEVIDGMKPLKAGPHLHVLHGHEFGGFMTNPVNPARGLFLRGKVNAVCGHFHQTSQHTEPGLGHPVSTWSSGCLCNLHPRYRPINKWDHSFLTIDLHRDQWSVGQHKIINGAVV